MSDSGAGPSSPAAPETVRPPKVRLILIRHGSSTWNEERRIQGQLDPPLSAKGHEQARRLAEHLGGRQLAGFYSSDLARARSTALAIAAGVELQPVLMPGLREVSLGAWEGLDREQIKVGYPAEWERWSAQPAWDIVPGGEGATQFEARVGSAIDEICARHPTGEILVVTHGGVIQVAILRIVGRGSDGPFSFLIENASMTVLEGRSGKWVVAKVNDTCHLT